MRVDQSEIRKLLTSICLNIILPYLIKTRQTRQKDEYMPVA